MSGDEVHPFEGALLMIEDLRAKEAEAYEVYNRAAEAVFEAERELPEIIRPFMKKAEKFLTQVVREETVRPNASVYFNTWAGPEKGVCVDLIISARLSEEEVDRATEALTRRFAEQSVKLTGLDPKHFSFRVHATKTLRKKAAK